MRARARSWVRGNDEFLLVSRIRIVREYKEHGNLPRGIVKIVPMKISDKKVALLYCAQVFKGGDLSKDPPFFYLTERKLKAIFIIEV